MIGESGKRGVRLAYLVTHPIQYQASLLRRLEQEPDINLTVFFCSNVSVGRFRDPEFGRVIEWDVPLLRGYEYQFLPALGGTERLSFWRPFNYGLARRLQEGCFDFLWVHGYARWYSWVAIAVAKRLGIKVLVRDETTPMSAGSGLARVAAKRMLFGGLKRMCDGFLAIGTRNREYYLQLGIEEGKLFEVPYAVDNEFFQATAAASERRRGELQRSLGLDPERPVILYASKLVSRKRPQDLLAAYARLSPDGRTEPFPSLLYVGDGEMSESLRKRAAELGWDSIKFLGFKNQTELAAYYNLCDLFVLPSMREPWGLVVNEAMNAARPVIVSDQVGCGADLVKTGENGFIFRAGDVESLCRVLRDALADRDRCRAMGRRSFQIIKQWGFEQDVAGVKASLAALSNGG